MKKKLNNKGFTIAEIIVAFALILVAALSVTPLMTNSFNDVKKSEDTRQGISGAQTDIDVSMATGVDGSNPAELENLDIEFTSANGKSTKVDVTGKQYKGIDAETGTEFYSFITRLKDVPEPPPEKYPRMTIDPSFIYEDYEDKKELILTAEDFEFHSDDTVTIKIGTTTKKGGGVDYKSQLYGPKNRKIILTAGKFDPGTYTVTVSNPKIPNDKQSVSADFTVNKVEKSNTDWVDPNTGIAKVDDTNKKVMFPGPFKSDIAGNDIYWDQKGNKAAATKVGNWLNETSGTGNTKLTNFPVIIGKSSNSPVVIKTNNKPINMAYNPTEGSSNAGENKIVHLWTAETIDIQSEIEFSESGNPIHFKGRVANILSPNAKEVRFNDVNLEVREEKDSWSYVLGDIILVPPENGSIFAIFNKGVNLKVVSKNGSKTYVRTYRIIEPGVYKTSKIVSLVQYGLDSGAINKNNCIENKNKDYTKYDIPIINQFYYSGTGSNSNFNETTGQVNINSLKLPLQQPSQKA